MALLEQKLYVKVASAGTEPVVYMVQADTGRSVRCIISDWTIPDDATATVYVKKPSAKIVYNTCEVDTSTNAIVVTITNQMIAETGLAAAQVEIASNDEVVTTFRFGIKTKYKIGGGTESTNESTVLQTMLDELAAEVNEAITNAETATGSANIAADAANEAAETATEAADTAAAAATTAIESAGTATEAASAAVAAAEDAIEAADSANEAASAAETATANAEAATEAVLESVNYITFSIDDDDYGLNAEIFVDADSEE